MANSNTAPQVPQHVSALLSHLTSRPGVQSTFILSRKDGSIIQSTGLLAPPKRARSETSSPTPIGPVVEAAVATTSPTPSSSPTAELQSTTTTSISASTSTSITTAQEPYQPSQAEVLAANIFAFVSSASNLSLSLSHPLGEGTSSRPGDTNDGVAFSSSTIGRDQDEEGEGSESQDDDEVKLLRLRTKKHEIMVVPDKKYLLCVVHDAVQNAAGNGTNLATGVGRSLGR